MTPISEESRLGLSPGKEVSRSRDGLRVLKVHFTETIGSFAVVEWIRGRPRWSKVFTLSELAALGEYAANLPQKEG